MIVPALRSRPAWASLERHYRKMAGVHLRQLFAEDRRRGERMAVEAAGIYLDYSKNRVTDETLDLLLQLARQSELQDRIEAMFRGDKINVSENRAVLHVALRAPRGASIILDGRNVVPEVHAVLDRMAEFAASAPERRLEGSHRQAHPQRDQHRHRRLGSRPGHGLRGAEALQRSRHDLPFRLQRRRHGFRRGGARSRSRGDPVHRLLEDLHHARDDDQRAYGARLAAGRPERRSRRHRQAFRRGLDQRPGSGEIRHRYGQHVRLLGLGRRALFHGLRHRPLDHGRDRSGQFPRHAGWLPRDGRAFPHRAVRAQPAGADGPARRLVQQFLRRPDRRRAAL